MESSKNQSIQLSPSQAEAVDAITHHALLNLVGPAGTGKTTTITEWARQQSFSIEYRCALCNKPLQIQTSSKTAKNPNRPFVSCRVCNYFSWTDNPCKPMSFVAPTHTAADVIKTTMNTDLSKYCDVITLASLLQYHQITNPITSEAEFRPRGKWIETKDGYTYVECRELKRTFLDKKVIIIDESSMITNQHALELIDYQRQFGFKLLFCGDHYQLNPVKAKMFFPIPNIPIVELREQHRSSHTGLSTCYSYLRECVRNHGEGFSWERVSKPRIHIVKECPLDVSTPIVLAWTNACVTSHNRRLREFHVGKENLEQKFVKGDIVVVTRPIVEWNLWFQWLGRTKKDQQLPEPPVEYTYKNGTRLIVQHADLCTLEYQSFLLKDSQGRPWKTTWKVWEIQAERIDSREESETSSSTFRFIDQDDSSTEKSFKMIYNRLKDIILKKTTTVTMEPSKSQPSKKTLFPQNALVQLAIRELDGIRQLSEYRNVTPIQYAYAMTVHKSQGSTFEDIVVDAKNIFTNPDSQEKWRLLYVAATRARHSITFLVS